MSELQQPQQQQQQPQPQLQQQQQPVLNYPNTAAGQPPSHHSNGSFGAVFIVLAVIVVISAIACFLGRLCNRRVETKKPKAEKNHSASARPRGKEPKLHPNKEGDIEFGFDMRNPSGKGKVQSGNGGSKGNGHHGHGHGHGVKPFENGGDMRSEIKHTDHHEAEFNFKAPGHA